LLFACDQCQTTPSAVYVDESVVVESVVVKKSKKRTMLRFKIQNGACQATPFSQPDLFAHAPGQ
jgi:hypothetical protein